MFWEIDGKYLVYLKPQRCLNLVFFYVTIHVETITLLDLKK